MAEESKPRGRPRKDGKPAGSVPPKPKGQLGGAREGAGRPKGSKNIYSKDSVKKLEELGFDPIERTVEMYHNVQKALRELEAANKMTSGAYASLQSTAGTLINNLMQYGYKKVPEKQEIEVENKKPLAVKLSLKPKEK